MSPLADGSPRWRLILGDGGGHDEPSPHNGPSNMAVDQALLDSVAAGAPPVLRLYRWSPATLSFGRNQPARGLYDEAAAADRRIAYVRRPTGGQAVLHDDELTYAVVAPVDLLGKPRQAYRRINEALVAGLRGLGVGAEIASPAPGQGGGRDGAGWAEACFRRPERGEVVAAGRKLVGSAQRTESRTILQHGSILLGGTQTPAEELLRGRSRSRSRPREGQRGGEAGWTTLESELGCRPPLDALVAAVVSGFEDLVGTSLARTSLTSEESAGATELRDRFESRVWTWRR